MKGLIEFVREQGVMGLAVGFILGGSISKLVTAFVNDLINPIVGIFLGRTGELKKIYLQVGSSKILYGDFISVFIDFAIIFFIVYLGVKVLKLETLYKKKT